MSNYTFKDFRWLNSSRAGLTADGLDVYLVGYKKASNGTDSETTEFKSKISEDGSLVDDFIDEITNNSHFKINIQNIIDNDIDIPFATTEKCGGILSDIHNIKEIKIPAAQVRFVSEYSNVSLEDRTYNIQIPKKHLAITGQQIFDALNGYYEENPDQLAEMFNIFRHSPTIKKHWSLSTDPDYNLSKVGFSLWGAGNPEKNGGKFLRLKTVEEFESIPLGEYSEERNYLAWTDLYLNTLVDIDINDENLTDGQVLIYQNGTWVNGEVQGSGNNYFVLSSGSSSDEEYVINGGGSVNTILNGNGQWVEAPLALGLVIDSRGIGIDISNARDGQVLTYIARRNTVAWVTPSMDVQYAPGVGIDITNNVIKQDISNTIVSQVNESLTELFIEDSITNDTYQVKVYKGSTLITTINEYQIAEITIEKFITRVEFRISHSSNNPIYIKLINRQSSSINPNGTYNYIGTNQIAASSMELLTLQFGIIKFEQVNTAS